MHRRSTQVARRSRRAGATVGTRVAVPCELAQFVITVLAAWKVGAVPVPVPVGLPDWERERVLEVIDA